MNAPLGPLPFGEERDRVTISVTEDALKAYMTLYVSDDDLTADNRVKLVKEIFDALNKKGSYGIKTELLAEPLRSRVEYLIVKALRQLTERLRNQAV